MTSDEKYHYSYLYIISFSYSRPLDSDETLVLIYPKKTTLAARLHLENFPEGSNEDML